MIADSANRDSANRDGSHKDYKRLNLAHLREDGAEWITQERLNLLADVVEAAWIMVTQPASFLTFAKIRALLEQIEIP